MRRDRAKIIELNDQLRTTFKGGRVQMTPNVYDLEPDCAAGPFLLSKYRKFDPESEHDWGTYIFGGYAFEWRIEYGPLGHGAFQKSGRPGATFRVLTLCDRRCFSLALRAPCGITGERWDEPRYHYTHEYRHAATCRDKSRQRFHPHD